MKAKISILTLFACAVAGTTFADVSAYRQSSGTETNSTTTTYVGNTDWVADSKTLGEKYIADFYTSREMPFEWNSDKQAFYVWNDLYHNEIAGGYYRAKGYQSYNFLFALSGTAQFSNSGRLTFGNYDGRESEEDDYNSDTGERTWSLENFCAVMIADNAKFTNTGTILTDFENTSDGSTVPDLEIWATDNAEFENSGKIFGNGSDKNKSNSPTEIRFEIVDNAKFVNTAKGAIEWCNADVRGNGMFENAGDADFTKFSMHENATVINTGEWYLNNASAFKGEDINGIFQFGFQKYEDSVAGTRQFENRGTFYVKDDVPVCFEIERDDTGALPTNVSAEFANYGKISVDGYASGKKSLSFLVAYKNNGVSDSSEKSNFETLLNSADLHVKNFGTINMSINVSSGVKLTLGEGSNISGDVSLGEEVTVSSYGTVTASKDVLNVVLTGEGGDKPLISGNLTLSNFFDLGVSFADDAVQKTKYSLTLWGGKLIATDGSYGNVASFTATSGTISGFGTTYEWTLDTTTGVLTAKDVNIDKEISVTDGTASVVLGAKDVATIESSVTEFSGSISGAGKVETTGDLTFSGDASALTGTLSVNTGTTTLMATAKLGSSAKVDVTGTLAIAGTRELSNTISGEGALITTGTVTLTGTNTFEGGVTIAAGKLIAGSESALGSGKTTVARGAELGLVAGTRVTVEGGVELAAGAKIVIDMSNISKAETFTLDLITTSALKYGETSITSENVNTLFANGAIELLNWDATGWTQSLSYADNTLALKLIAIPEPSAFGLLAGVGALAFVAARRRRRAK